MIHRHSIRPVALAACLLAVVSFTAGCGSSDDATATTTTAKAGSSTAKAGSTTAAAKELTVLVSNDDGVGAAGLDTLVQALRQVPDTKVIVAAPATNQSGTGGRTTPGGAPASPATTASGYAATSVAGFPADAVDWALSPGGIGVTPDVVITGINQGQNLGSTVEISGTVGAARAAAAKGVPALAVSQGLADKPDYATGAKLALAWLADHRADLLSGAGRTTPARVENLNVPTCTAGTVKGVVEVPVDTAAPPAFTPVDCSVPATDPTNDVAAFQEGFAPLSVLAA